MEEKSEVCHEYFDGEIFVMAGASKSHNLLAQNLALSLRMLLRGKGCQVLMEDVRLAVQENNHYACPSVAVSCDPADCRDP